MKDFLSRLRDEYGPIESTHDFFASLRKQYDVSEDIAVESDVDDNNGGYDLKYDNKLEADNKFIPEIATVNINSSSNILKNADIVAGYQDKPGLKPSVSMENQITANKKYKFTIGLFIEDEDDLEDCINKLEDFSRLDEFFEKNKKLEFDPDKKYKKHYEQEKEKFLKKVSDMYKKIQKYGIDEDTTETVVDKICEYVSKYFVRGLLRICYDAKCNKQNDTQALKFFQTYERKIDSYLRQIGFTKLSRAVEGEKLSEADISKYEWPAGNNGNRIKTIAVCPYRISYKNCYGEGSKTRYVEGIAYTTDEKRGKEHD